MEHLERLRGCIAVLLLVFFQTQVSSVTGGVHECSRECVAGAPPMTCSYQFSMEWYVTMSKACYDCRHNVSDCFRQDCVPADGYTRPVIVVNRQMPGPSIEVCQGDYVIVDVHNHMMEESTSMHWHGLHQRGSPYMDGVPFVTQCPIPPKTSFRYQFLADNPGTHFWHSHSGCQRADGAYGGLVVRVPYSRDPHRDQYDLDMRQHLVHVIDWVPEIGVHKFVDHHHGLADNKPRNVLVNGLGRNISLLAGQPEGGQPTATFVVKQGFRYRFRLINAGFLNVPIQMSVDNHTITVLSTDGMDVEPVEVDSLVSYAGERFDFVVSANQSVGNYWVRFRGLMDGDERFTNVYQVAILRYEGAPHDEDPPGDVGYEEARREGLTLNELNVGTEGNNGTVAMPGLTALQPDDESLKPVADFTFYLAYDFYPIDNPHFYNPPFYGFGDASSYVYTPQLNHISMKLPPFPLLSQRHLVTPDMFCNASTVGNCTGRFCECPHVLSVPLGAVVEFVFIDEGVPYDANHPFHLHGHAFRVVAMERLGATTSVHEVQARDAAGLVRRNLSRPPLKDTVTVPDGGYTIVRVLADNPGYWLLHCHIEFHVEIGMALVLKVGEHSDMPPVPGGFPQCNNWLPTREELAASQLSTYTSNSTSTSTSTSNSSSTSTTSTTTSPSTTSTSSSTSPTTSTSPSTTSNLTSTSPSNLTSTSTTTSPSTTSTSTTTSPSTTSTSTTTSPSTTSTSPSTTSNLTSTSPSNLTSTSTTTLPSTTSISTTTSPSTTSTSPSTTSNLTSTSPSNLTSTSPSNLTSTSTTSPSTTSTSTTTSPSTTSTSTTTSPSTTSTSSSPSTTTSTSTLGSAFNYSVDDNVQSNEIPSIVYLSHWLPILAHGHSAGVGPCAEPLAALAALLLTAMLR